MTLPIMNGLETFLFIFLAIWGGLGALTYLYDFLLNKKLIKYETTTFPVEKREITGKSIKDLRQICQIPKRGYGKYSIRLKIYRFFSIFITRIFIETPITANQITVFSIIVGLVSAVFFAFGNYFYSLIAALILLSIEYWDCWDGEIARYKGISSLKGVYIDGIAHTLISPTIFAGITLGVFISTNKIIFLVFGILSIIFSALLPLIQGTKDSKFLYKLMGFSKGHGLIDLPPKKEHIIENKVPVKPSFLKVVLKRGYNFFKFTFLKYIIALAAILELLPYLLIIFGIVYPLLWLLFFVREANSGTDNYNHLIDPYRPKENET